MQNRIFYLDALKVFALFSVILLHSSAKYLYEYEVVSIDDWSIANFYNSISRAGVPLFFMISGALLLPREMVLEVIIEKVIKRLIFPLIVWTLIYIFFKKVLLMVILI